MKSSHRHLLQYLQSGYNTSTLFIYIKYLHSDNFIIGIVTHFLVWELNNFI